MGRLHIAGTICQHYWTHYWSISGALCTPFQSQHQKPLMFRKGPQNHCSIAYYLIFSFVICLNLVQILCHSWGNSTQRTSWHCDSRWWEEKAASFFLTKDEKEGEGETHARMLLPFIFMLLLSVSALQQKGTIQSLQLQIKGEGVSFVLSFFLLT